MGTRYEIGLFALSEEDGARLLGRTGNSELIRLVRNQLRVSAEVELGRLDEVGARRPPLRVVRPEPEEADAQSDP